VAPLADSIAAIDRLKHHLAIALVVAAAACRTEGTKPAEPAKPTDDITIQQFRDLIEQGALKPVPVDDNPEAFKDPKPDVEGDSFARAADAIAADQKKKEEARKAELAASPASAPQAAGASGAAASSAASKPGEVAAPPKPGDGAAAPAPSSAPAAQAAAPAPKPADAKPPEKPVEVSGMENPYLQFGKRIQVYPNSGLIFKPYPLRVGTGKYLKKLIETYGNFPLWKPELGPQAADKVRVDLEERWDSELFADLRLPVPVEGTLTGVADWLLVTAGYDQLKEVEDFINIFAAGVPQIEIEAKIVEVTTTDTLDLGVKPVSDTVPIFGFPSSTFVKAFTYALPNMANGSGMNSLLTLGAVQDGLKFNIALQALATNENVSIISRPRIAVREGGTAQIVNTLKIPVYTVNGISATGTFSAALTYEEVGIKLYVVPRVVGTRTVALSIDVEASAEQGSLVTFAVAGGPTLSNPQISKRAAKTIVYLEPGQAVILGGLINEQTIDSVDKVPILGDIPLLGYLFRSTFKKKQQTNVLFFLHPRILQGSDMNREF
jgi:type II secretory pathway component GspD/PulD (secretin)